MAGLNYFLTHGARGGEGTKLLGEKRDVKVWLGWLERRAHGDVEAIETPIGYIPKYEDLKPLFAEIDKDYPRSSTTSSSPSTSTTSSPASTCRRRPTARRRTSRRGSSRSTRSSGRA